MPPEMQSTILIAAGNYFHGDEAVSHRVLSLLGSQQGVSMHDVLQWTGELAPKIAGAAEVVFVDSDTELG